MLEYQQWACTFEFGFGKRKKKKQYPNDLSKLKLDQQLTYSIR